MFKLRFRWDYFLLLSVFLTGIFIRLKLYFFNTGLHCDEANLALNMISSTFLELFKPLDRLQVAPPVFLILSKVVYQLVIFNFKADFSDLLLKFIPLASGLISIPAMAYLLNNIYRNVFITVSGTILIALNPAAVSYSCVYKQYEFEMLAAIVILILFLKINFERKYLGYFAFLGAMPYFSLSSFFILFPGLLYLFTKDKGSKKNILPAFLTFGFVLLSFVLITLIPVFTTHYSGMADYWGGSFESDANIFNYFKIFMAYIFRTSHYVALLLIMLVSSIIIFIKQKRLLLITLLPLILMYAAACLRLYPLDERVILFALPCVIILILYPLSLIPQKKEVNVFFNTLLVCALVYGIFTFPKGNSVIVKQETGKNLWNWLSHYYDGKSPVVTGYSLSSGLYYRMFYADKMNLYNKAVITDNYKAAIEALPQGEYYFVISRYENYDSEFENFLNNNVEIISQKTFLPDTRADVLNAASGRVIKIKKN